MIVPLPRIHTALAVLVGGAAAAHAQIDLTDQSTSPPSIPLTDDLSVPVVEPMPPGGWPYAPSTVPGPPVSASESLAGSIKASGPASAFAAPASIRELMTEPLVVDMGDGEVWARTRSMRARFAADGFTAYPVFGSTSPREWPVQFRVRTVTLGGEPLDASVAGEALHSAGRVTIPRSDLSEVYHLALDSIEQTFVFEDLPGGGDLVVQMDVETDLEFIEAGEWIRFEHESFGGVSYGEAFAVDADGRRTAIERTWTGDGIALRVPAEFVAEATMPLTIDPPVTSWTNTFGAADDANPDVTFAGNPGRYFICWQEYTSSTNADVYMINVSLTGVQGSALAVEITNDYWEAPRLAYIPAGPRLLVVASETLNGPGTGSGAIKGQRVNPVTNSLAGSEFFISTSGSFKVDPDVGGTNYTSTSNNHFLVAWSRILSTTTRTIEYRVIDWTGSAITPVTPIANMLGDENIRPAISESHGDANLGGDWWTLAWIRDDDGDGDGEIWARRVVWSGLTTLGAGNFQVGTESSVVRVAVTSNFDEELLSTGDRPSIVAYERRLIVGGFDANLYARVITDGEYYSANLISSEMEDFDGSLIQTQPAIGADGRAFVMSYAEEYWSGGSPIDYDQYMLSGNIVEFGNDARLALSERHKNMAFTAQPEIQGRIAMEQDGNRASISDDGFCVWTRIVTASRGELRGYVVDAATANVSALQAVGVQYCNANPNSVSYGGGRNRSWLSIIGNQQITSTHTAIVSSMPNNTFGYLNCSRTSGSFQMPGGSQGHLCLGGNNGRYVNQVGNSGTNGLFTTAIVPTNLPLPTGFVSAAPGETWYFQVWHRDTVSGTSTSNFSNACAVHFLP